MKENDNHECYIECEHCGIETCGYNHTETLFDIWNTRTTEGKKSE